MKTIQKTKKKTQSLKYPKKRNKLNSKERIKSEILGHIIGLPNPAVVLSNLATQLRSIILFNKVMKDDSTNLLATPLEAKLLSYKKSEVFAVIKELQGIYKS